IIRHGIPRRCFHKAITMGYWTFLRDNWRLIGFGFTLTFFSAFGQTYFVSLFGAEIRKEFGLTHGQFGAAYSIATLASAISLIWFGRLIDRVDLRAFAVAICAGMMVATIAVTVTPGLTILIVAFFGLRLTGQGLMIHTAHTSMARYFAANRGKAIALAHSGQPLAEAILPSVAVALMALIGWRATWALACFSVLVIALPLIFWLLRGHATRHKIHLAKTSGVRVDHPAHSRHWTRGEVLRDPRFYAILVVLAVFPFMGTALFFHQVHIAESKGWSLPWLAATFTLFAAATVPSALATGAIVDRLGAIRVFPFILFPFVAALIPLIFFDGPWVAVPYMGFLGVAVGFHTPIANALLVELYGTTHLGAIRAMMTSALVFTSAPSPALVGWAIDIGASVEMIAGSFVAYMAAAIAISFIVARHGQGNAP
ncbi:MAG: MFS transporter, partial [Alphaproteobacteria bacterium]